MYLCIGTALAGVSAFVWCIAKHKREAYGIYCMIFMISGAFGALICLRDIKQDQSRPDNIQRPQAGAGALEKDYLLTVEELAIREPYHVIVENRHLTKRELEELFTKAVAELERTFLGENESLDYITHNVILADSVMDGRVDVSWRFDDYKAVNLCGELQEEFLSEEGTLVQVAVTLEYEGAQAQQQFSMMVYPPEKTLQEQFYKLLAQELQTRNNGTEAMFALPKTVAGHKLIWSRQPNQEPYMILLVGLCAVAGVAIGKKEDARKAKEKRDAQLLAEYPQMLSQMALLLGAGMTVSHAWERIVLSYDNRCSGQAGGGQKLPVYEEMRITYHQMKDGIGERLAYEQFGERLQLQVYRRLATLLVQNLRKGTAGLSKLLEREMQDALDAQENFTKKRGEELQTKLLLPMMLMLGLVIVIIMIPAVANFQM